MKAVFVDGASLFCMAHVVGVPRMSFLALYDLLVKDVGEQKRLAAIPLIVLRPDLALSLGKPLAGAGFEVLPATTSDGSDDRVIIERIKALDVSKVTELVLVSNDRDYMPVVKFKIMEGLSQVLWMGTKKLDTHNVSSMSYALKNLLKQPGFQFIEIEDHKERLILPAREPPLAQPSAVAVPAE